MKNILYKLLFMLSTLIVVIGSIYYHVRISIDNKNIEGELSKQSELWYAIIPDKFENVGTMPQISRMEPNIRLLLGIYDPVPMFDRNEDRFVLNREEQKLYDIILSGGLSNDGLITHQLIVRSRRAGGNFAGIVQKIPYLKELGITTVLLHPIFLAESPMRYDIVDYRRIDPALTSNHDLKYEDVLSYERDRAPYEEDFFKMIEKLHTNGIKIVLDMPFVYIPINNYLIEDIARFGPESEYLPWIEGIYLQGGVGKERLPSTYICNLGDFYTDDELYPYAKHIWFNGRHKHCPLVYVQREYPNTGVHPGWSDYFERILMRYIATQKFGEYVYKGVDGVRLDAYPELEKNRVRTMKEKIYARYPNFLFVAEDRGSDFGYVQEGTVHTMTSYLYRTLIQTLFIQKNQRQLNFIPMMMNRFERFYQENTSIIQKILFPIESHDTDRVLQRLVFTNRDKGSSQIYERNLDDIIYKGHYIWDSKLFFEHGYMKKIPNPVDIFLYESILGFQFFLPGIPLLYQGSELGMIGGDDPDNRMPMLRSEDRKMTPCVIGYENGVRSCLDDGLSLVYGKNLQILELTKKFINLRQSYAILQYGDVFTDILLQLDGRRSLANDMGSIHGLVVMGRRYQAKEALYISNQSAGYETYDVGVYVGPGTTWFDPINDVKYQAGRDGLIDLGRLVPESYRMLFEE